MSNDSLKTTNQQPPKSSMTPWIVAVGALLFLAVGYLTYANFGKSSEIDQKVAELKESEALRMELETQFNQSIADLEDMRTTNEELNKVIEGQKTELEEQRTKIAGLISSKSKGVSVRKELEKMKALAQQYVAQVEQLQAENAQLASTNTLLGQEKSELSDKLQTQVVENSQLSEAKSILSNEKNELAEKNSKLSATVNLASVIRANAIQVEGFKTRDGGKLVKKKSADSVDDIQVCFEAAANEVAKAGEETYYIRLIDPAGETLAIEDKGAGMTQNLKTGEKIKFTKSVVKNYKNQPMQVCTNWKPSTALPSGKYQVEIFNKGHLAGKSSFELK